MDTELQAAVFTLPKDTIYRTLYDMLDAWQESYCHTGDDGGRVEDSIVSHARCMLAMPEASLKEMLEWLLHNS